MTKVTLAELFDLVDKRDAEVVRMQRIADARERVIDLARIWATGFSGGSFNLIDAVRELEEAEK